MPKITLKAARINTGFTQKDAAKAIGVNISTLKNWESGKTYPRQPMIEKMCDIYGIKYDNIFFGK